MQIDGGTQRVITNPRIMFTDTTSGRIEEEKNPQGHFRIKRPKWSHHACPSCVLGESNFLLPTHPATKLCDSRRFTYTAQPIIPPSTIYIAGEPKSDCLELGTETDHDSKEIGLRHLRNNLGAPINGVTRANCQS